MITRTWLHPVQAVRYSWKNILFSLVCAGAAYAMYTLPAIPRVEMPVAVITVLGTALAIILGFRNASAYDRWWEARKIWGGVVNESRTFTRMALTLADPRHTHPKRRAEMERLVRNHLAWVNALRLQLRSIRDEAVWRERVGVHLEPETYDLIMSRTNRVTQLGILQGRLIKLMNMEHVMDDFSYVQIDDTMTRLTDLQGMAERIKNTPLPRPYDYYTMAFLSLFLVFFPFSVADHFADMGRTWIVFPLTVVVGWIFYQIYVFGKVMSNPFENWSTDIPMDAITTTIMIDLKETLGDKDVPAPLTPAGGRLM
ncbi:MAG: hypothetical protein KIT10_01985 [Flavobacteriales bacterium]|nr:hypothetical protein [Flavobacteriales bacterium]